MVTSDFKPEVEIQPSRSCAMHPAIIIVTVRSLIVDVAMGQIPRSTERISSFDIICWPTLWPVCHADKMFCEKALHCPTVTAGF